MIVTTTIIGPAAWASYLVNGDASGLEPGEQRKADAWLERNQVRILSTKDDTTYFSNALNVYAPEFGYRSGDVVDYIAEDVPVTAQFAFLCREAEKMAAGNGHILAEWIAGTGGRARARCAVCGARFTVDALPGKVGQGVTYRGKAGKCEARTS